MRYRVIFPTASQPGNPPPVYIGDQSSRPMSADTTDIGGHATKRRAVVRVQSLSALDSVVVEGAVQYKGAPLKGSPVRLVIPAKLLIP